jgi:hypothetical protein
VVKEVEVTHASQRRLIKLLDEQNLDNLVKIVD